ncbi:Plasmid related protein [Pseudomonas orientalis]|nr:Plasmid related protein [Pseudomonas orientalis]
MPAFVTLQPRFPVGGLTISRCVDALIRQDLLDPLPYVRRHICGDWGDVRAEHRRYNDTALELGGYLLSSYAINDGLDLCIFTEADRNLTAVFLLDEY